MKKFLTFVKKEILQIRADRFMLRFLIAAPLLQLLVLGFSLNQETRNVTTVVCDLNRTQLSRQIIDGIRTNDRFKIIEETTDYEELEQSLRRWKAVVGLYIPPDFSQTIQKEGTGTITVLLDAVNGNEALTAYGYIHRIVTEKSLSLVPVRIRTAYLSGGGIITADYHYWYNPELRNESYMVPGVAVLIITVTTLMMGASSLVREKETGTLDQLLVMPLSKFEIIAGKLLPFFIYACAELSVLLFLSGVIFKIQFAGSLLLLYGAVLLYLFTTLGLGLYISVIAGTQQQALFIAWFFMIFMILLSGFLMPIDNMPHWLQYITLLNPMRYMMTCIREIYLKATPLQQLLRQLLPLGSLGGGMLAAGTAVFSRKTHS
ncbi:MAG: ABC transporter permease [Treponema sp.]|jgi:ABC-2 type transport system permease protein|nr:ABC transporter permease [Treponema sp.]